MAISSDDEKERLHHQQEFEKFQVYLLTILTQQFQMQMATQNVGNLTSDNSVDLLVNNIPNFMHGPAIFFIFFF